MKVFSLKTLIGFLAVLMICAAPAYAKPMLDFGVIAPTPGSISFGGGGCPLVGSDIQVDNVIGLDTVLNPSVPLTLSNAKLNFTTGAHTGSWNFGGGATSSITIVGGIPALGIADGSTLLTGGFGSAFVTGSGTTFHIAGASFSDFKHDDLLTFYGLPTTLPNGDPMPYSGHFNISFNTATAVNSGASFTSSQVLSGDITNEPIPEPGTLLLLGSGLMGLAGYGKLKLHRRKKSA